MRNRAKYIKLKNFQIPFKIQYYYFLLKSSSFPLLLGFLRLDFVFCLNFNFFFSGFSFNFSWFSLNCFDVWCLFLCCGCYGLRNNRYWLFHNNLNWFSFNGRFFFFTYIRRFFYRFFLLFFVRLNILHFDFLFRSLNYRGCLDWINWLGLNCLIHD